MEREQPEHAEVPEIREERKHYVVEHICDLYFIMIPRRCSTAREARPPMFQGQFQLFEDGPRRGFPIRSNNTNALFRISEQ